MLQVKVYLNERPYLLNCEEGQEQPMKELAARLDMRLKELSESVGQIGDLPLLVMASLVLEDELAQKDDKKTLIAPITNEQTMSVELMRVFTTRLNRLADRIDAVVETLTTS